MSEAKRIRRHSFRHWLANAMRILKFDMADMHQGGRWKEGSSMPLRYAQEVKFVVHVDIISRVARACEAALSRVREQDWPLFGGWENLLPEREPTRRDEPVEVQHLFVPGDDDVSGGEDSSDEEIDFELDEPYWPAEWPGQEVEVYWTEDRMWYPARIYRSERGQFGELGPVALFAYADGVEHFHYCKDVEVRLAAGEPLSASRHGDPLLALRELEGDSRSLLLDISSASADLLPGRGDSGGRAVAKRGPGRPRGRGKRRKMNW